MIAAAAGGDGAVLTMGDDVTTLQSGVTVDPHIWFDPIRVNDRLDVLADKLEGAGVAACAAEFSDALLKLDAEIMELVDDIPIEERVLVTNHASLGYFADRYGFEVAAVVLPGSGSTEVSPAHLETVAQLMKDAGVGVIFADTSRGTAEG